MSAQPFMDDWRRRKSAAFDLSANSTAGHTRRCTLWGRPHDIYANANLSIYSAQACNARCPFCVEELRPASRGGALQVQKTVETDDGRYFGALQETLEALRPLAPSVSITGGEPSLDRRLPRILRMLQAADARKRTITTNGSGLLCVHEDRALIDWVADTGIRHLNISRAHPDHDTNARIMRYQDGPSSADLREIIARASRGGTRVRLSCVLLDDHVSTLADIVAYLAFAEQLGIDNVIFRQLMRSDPQAVTENYVVRYSDRQRVLLEPILDAIQQDTRFEFTRQIMGYYYYVEVWRYRSIDVVFEEADLAQLERNKRSMPGVIHELVFHPNARLCSTWQPWDGVLGPAPSSAVPAVQAQPMAAVTYDGRSEDWSSPGLRAP